MQRLARPDLTDRKAAREIVRPVSRQWPGRPPLWRAEHETNATPSLLGGQERRKGTGIWLGFPNPAAVLVAPSRPRYWRPSCCCWLDAALAPLNGDFYLSRELLCANVSQKLTHATRFLLFCFRGRWRPIKTLSFSSFVYLLLLQVTHATPFSSFVSVNREGPLSFSSFSFSSSIATCRAMNFAGAGQNKSFGTFWKLNRMFSKHFWNVSEIFECFGTLLKCFPIPKHLNVPEHFGTSEKF